MTPLDLAAKFVEFVEGFLQRHAGARGDARFLGLAVAAWAERYELPELLTHVRALRPELVAEIGTSADVTRRARVADVARVFRGKVAPWPTAWRAQLRQGAPQLAERLTRMEAVIDRQAAAQAARRGSRAWRRALARYEDALEAIAVWLDRTGRRCS